MLVDIHQQVLQDGRRIHVLRHVQTGMAIVIDEQGNEGAAHPEARKRRRPSSTVVACGLHSFDTSACVIRSDLDIIAVRFCNCGGNHGRR